MRLTVTEKFRGRRLIAVTAGGHAATHRKVVVVGTSHLILSAGQSHTVLVALNRTGKHLLARRHRLTATLRVLQVAGGHVSTVSTQTNTFKTRRHHRRNR